jgi:3-methyladenine DNA glycosylase AlkD
MTKRGGALLAELRRELEKSAEPARAAGMQAYMKSAMPYLGVSAVPLRAACKRVFADHPIVDPRSWERDVLYLWQSARHREERYAAIELSGDRRARAFQTLAALPMYEEIIVSGAWWDYVDPIATHRLDLILRAEPRAMKKAMLAWSRSDDIWKRRSAILCQITFKADTDLDLLYRCIEPSMSSKEFFLRKAIGWALRQYAWTDPRQIVRYVREHEDELSPLSKREALKNV